MACISKILSSFDYDCDSGATGVVEALLLEKADISSFTVDPTDQAVITALTVSGVVRSLETPKRVLVLNSALKINEGAPNAFTHSGSLTITAETPRGSTAPGKMFSEVINPLANTAFVIIARTLRPTGSYLHRVYGLYYGMSATAVDHSTLDNGGWTTVAFSTPENVIGEDALVMASAEYDRLKALAV